MTSNSYSINAQFYRVKVFPSRDPIEEDGGINLYGLLGNDAVNRWDNGGLVGRVQITHWQQEKTIETPETARKWLVGVLWQPPADLERKESRMLAV